MPSREELVQMYKDDPKLMIESYLKVQHKETGKLVPFKLNVGQNYAYERFQRMRSLNKPVRIIILKARQLGMSTLACALQLWRSILWKRTTCFTVSLTKDESAGALLDKIKTHYGELPNWLRPMLRYNTKSHIDFSNDNAKERVINPGHQSKIWTAAGNDPHACRSHTPQYVHMSEFSMWPQAEVTLSSIMNAMPTEPETFAVIESTANGASGKFYEMWKEANSSLNPTWWPVFIPFWVHKEYCHYNLPQDEQLRILTSLTDYEKSWMDQFKLTVGQISWSRHKVNELGSLSQFLQDYAPNATDCFLVQGDSVFNKDKIRELSFRIAHEKPPVKGHLERSFSGKIEFRVDSNGPVSMWEPPEPNSVYAIGVDPCSAVGEQLMSLTPGERKKMGRGANPDKCGIQVLKIKGTDLEQVAEVHGYINPERAGEIAIMLGQLYNWCMIMPEADGVGHALMKTLRRYPHLGYYERADKIGLDINIHSRLGWTTNKKSIHLLQQGLMSAIDEGRLLIRSRSFVKEMTTFVKKDNGKLEAASGANDDLLSAMALAIQAVEQATRGNMKSSVYSPPDDGSTIWTPQGNFPLSVFATEEEFLDSYRSRNEQKPDDWMYL